MELQAYLSILTMLNESCLSIYICTLTQNYFPEWSRVFRAASLIVSSFFSKGRGVHDLLLFNLLCILPIDFLMVEKLPFLHILSFSLKNANVSHVKKPFLDHSISSSCASISLLLLDLNLCEQLLSSKVIPPSRGQSASSE